MLCAVSDRGIKQQAQLEPSMAVPRCEVAALSILFVRADAQTILDAL